MNLITLRHEIEDITENSDVSQLSEVVFQFSDGKTYEIDDIVLLKEMKGRGKDRCTIVITELIL